MAIYSARDGVPQDMHLVHLGARALGGAGLVFVEMTSPVAQGRITPACTGLWNGQQQAAFMRIVDFVHGQTDARIGIQLGHSGPKGSTQLGWQQIDEPLPADNWPLVAASAQRYGEHNQLPVGAVARGHAAAGAGVRGQHAARGGSGLRLAGAALARTATCCRRSSRR